MSGLIWVQTVCKGYQQMTKVTTSQERLKNKASCLTILTHGLLKWTLLSLNLDPFIVANKGVSKKTRTEGKHDEQSHLDLPGSNMVSAVKSTFKMSSPIWSTATLHLLLEPLRCIKTGKA